MICIILCFEIVEDSRSGGVPVTKKRRLAFTLPTIAPQENWSSEFNLDGKVETSQIEVGDGASSRVYVGSLHGMTVAVKQLKCYSPRLASCLIKAYEHVFHLRHDNLVRVFGICPKVGYIVMEYCQKVIDGHTLRTLGDLLLYYGNDLPEVLRIAALSDVAEGLQYLHSQSLIHGDIKPHNVLVTGTEQEFLFKITDYSCIMHINSKQLSSKSSSLKQLMTPGYLAPELISDTGSYLNPTKASDVYSFAILAYEVAFCCDPWPNVSMQLIDSVRRGYRPVIPDNASKFMSAIIQECWQHDSSSRPYVSQVSQLLGEHLDRLTSSDTCSMSSSNTPTTALLECNTVSMADSVGINSNTLSTGSVHPILNHGDHNGSCDTATVNNTQTCLNCHNESMQSGLDYTSDSNGITRSCSSTPSRGTCNVDANIETDLEILPQDSPGGYLALDTELVSNSQAINDVEYIQIDSDHDRHAYKDLSQSSTNDTSSIEEVKTTLCIKEFKEFQIKTIDAIAHGNDVILVQPTGSGKSLCFTVPALLNPRKVCIVIEPVVAIINNQVEALQKKALML